MNIIKDSDLIWETDNFDVILVGTTIYCSLPDGFQRKMRRKYPYIKDANNTTPYADPRKLGKRLTIQGKPIISLCYISKFKTKNEFIDYDALEKLARQYKPKLIISGYTAYPRIIDFKRIDN